MDTPRIMIVEDEGIIAQDIKNCLENLGYNVPDVVYTGTEAIEKAAVLRPDLVLMDIVLKGEIDGIETAQEIRNKYNIPIVYLTAYEDDKTLKRAKLTQPLGYILKPFEERYLRSSIEMALYKHKMENKVKENERWLATILKSVGDAVIVTNENLEVKYMNPVAEYLTGWAIESSMDRKLDEVYKVIDEETRETLVNSAKRSLQDNTITGLAHSALLITREGKEIPIDDTASPMRDDDGKVNGVVLIFQDISERKIAENTIKENERRYRNLFDNATDAIFVESLSGEILSVNNEACNLLGYTKNDLYRTKLSEIVTNEFYEKLPEIVETLKLKGIYTSETKHKRKDGQWLDVEVRMSLIKVLDEDVIQVFVDDITELKKSREQVNILAHAIKSISECVSITDLNEKIIFINDAFIQTYGYTFEELKGKSLNIIRSQKNTKDIIKEIHEETKKNGWQGELINRSKDGREFPIILSTSIIRNDQGKPIAYIGVAVDISERKRLENAIRNSEKDYKGLFENAHDAIIISRPEDSIILDVNQRACEVYGYTKAELIGMSLENITKESQPGMYSFLEMNAGKDTKFETIHIKRDGSEMLLEVNAAQVDYKGQTAIISINRDVTERKVYEQTLRESDARKSAILDSSIDAIITFSSKAKIIEWNGAAEIIFGYTKYEIVDKNIESILLPKTATNGYRHNLEILFNTEESPVLEKLYETSLLRKNNVEFPAEISIAKIELDDGLIYTATIRDITERKKAIEALREREKQYKNLAQNAPIAVTRINIRDNNYDFVNDEFVRQSGYTMEEYNNLSNEELINIIHPDDREKIFSFYKNWEENGHKETQHLDYKIINRNNEVICLDTFLYADFDETGNAAAINQVCIDVTEQKKAQEKIIEKDKRFRALIENSSDLIALIDENNVIKYASPSTTRILGYNIEEFENHSGFDFILKDDHEKIKSILSDLAAKPGTTVTYQYRCLHKNGMILWMEATGTNLINDPIINAIVINYEDISGRKKAEEEILLQKSYFQQLFENSPEGIVMIDINDKIIDINKGFEKLFQYNKEEITGKVIDQIIVPENLSEQAVQLSKFVKKGDIIYKETSRKRKDGSSVDVSILGYPIFLGKDQIGVYGIYSDITERKETDRALLKSQERYRAFVQQSSEGIWRFEFLESINTKLPIDKQIDSLFKYGYLAECNDVLAKMYGFQTVSEIVSLRLNELLPESDPANVEYLKNFINSGYRITDAESHEKDENGNDKYFLNNLVGIIEDGFIVRAWGSRRDITASRLAEEELHKTQFRLATLLENFPDVVLYETGSGREFISENVIELLGYPSSKFTEDREFFNKIMHPTDSQISYEKVKKWHDEGSPGLLIQEFRCRRSDGEYIWIEDHMIQIQEPNGQAYMAGVLVNITDRKKIEERLKQLADKLTLSNKELEQFAYVASHDLQEPLRMVASYIQLLQRRYKGQLEGDADEFINFAVDGVVRMKALINDLLMYSRVNRQEVPMEEVDCNLVMEQVKYNLKSTITDNNALVTNDDLPTIIANPLQLNQLFQNLISNGIKFHGKESPKVNISVSLNGEEWLFAVKDNGIGIEKEYTEKIFVIFQRLHSVKEYAGTGIGLAICKKIVEKMGGHLWVESEPGDGSTFFFTVPVKKETEK
jgi:PAS domain S-box-containing protein